MAQSGSRSARLITKWACTHPKSYSLCWQRRSVQAELLSPIKDACHVWAVCFLVMPGPSGSSQVNKSMSFDKHASHPHAHVLPGAVWFIRVNVTDVWKPPMRPSPFLGLLADSIRTHKQMHTRVFLKLESTLLALADAHTRSSRRICWWQCVYHQPTHAQHMVIPTHVAPYLFKETKTHTHTQSFCPPRHHFKHDLIKTTLTRLLSSHLISLPSLCFLSL